MSGLVDFSVMSTSSPTSCPRPHFIPTGSLCPLTPVPSHSNPVQVSTVSPMLHLPSLMLCPPPNSISTTLFPESPGQILPRSLSLVSDRSIPTVSLAVGPPSVAPAVPSSLSQPPPEGRASYTALQASRGHRRALRRARAAASRKSTLSVGYSMSGSEDGRKLKIWKRVRNRQAVSNCRLRKIAKLAAATAEHRELLSENARLKALLTHLECGTLKYEVHLE